MLLKYVLRRGCFFRPSYSPLPPPPPLTSCPPPIAAGKGDHGLGRAATDDLWPDVLDHGLFGGLAKDGAGDDAIAARLLCQEGR